MHENTTPVVTAIKRTVPIAFRARKNTSVTAQTPVMTIFLMVLLVATVNANTSYPILPHHVKFYPNDLIFEFAWDMMWIDLQRQPVCVKSDILGMEWGYGFE